MENARQSLILENPCRKWQGLRRLTTVFGIGVDLFKSISRMEDLLRFPSYFNNVSTYDQILCFSWFPSNSCYHSNGDAKHFILNNVDYLEI